MSHPTLLFALCLLATQAVAQTSFVETTPDDGTYFTTPSDEDFWVNAVAPADVDNDGRLDIAVIGFHVVYDVSVDDRLVLLHNDGTNGDGSWAYSAVEVPLGGIVAGASDLAWGDVDGDGDFDLVVGSEGDTVLFRNDEGNLVRTDSALPGYNEDSAYEDSYDQRSLTFVDYDNDGDQDLLIPSVYDWGTFSYRTALMRNDGSDGAGGIVFTDIATTIDATSNAQSAWTDADGDGDLDLFLANVDPYTETGFVRFYINDAGSFPSSDPIDIRVEHGLADSGDVDADGDPDVLVAGNIQESDGSYTTVLRMYSNDAGTFTPTTLIQAPGADWLDLHAAAWADYDSDGDVDVLVTGTAIGEGEIVGKSAIHANDAGTFSPLLELPAPIGSVGRGGTFSWFDLDGDGDLDYLVAGAFFVPGGNGLVEARMRLFRNDAIGTNAPPAAPTSLTSTQTAAGVVLAWDVPADDHTSAAQLTYDVELRRDGVVVHDPRRLPQSGAINAASQWTFAGLAPGHYTWRVRAVDSAFAGSLSGPATFIVPVGVDAIFADDFDA